MNDKKFQRITGLAIIIVALSAVGCSEKAAAPSKANAPATATAENDPRAKVLGVEHVGTAKESPGTTSTAKSDITKAQQESAMPLPGQANDHSTLSPKATQKSTNTSTGAAPKP